MITTSADIVEFGPLQLRAIVIYCIELQLIAFVQYNEAKTRKLVEKFAV